MCSHYIAEKARQQLARLGVQLPLDWEPGPGSRHIYPTQWAPIVRRPPEHDLGDDAVLNRELVLARFGLLPGFAKDEKYGLRTYNARSESSTYQRNTFRFAVPVGTTVPGSISTTQYSASSCTGTPLTGSETVVPVNFHYVRQLTVTSGTPATAQGTAVELLITEVASGASQTFTVGFLPDFLKFAGGTSSFFNAASLRYNKL